MKELEELKDLFEAFLDEKGLYWTFIEWMKERGEDLEKFGFEDE